MKLYKHHYKTHAVLIFQYSFNLTFKSSTLRNSLEAFAPKRAVIKVSIHLHALSFLYTFVHDVTS